MLFTFPNMSVTLLKCHLSGETQTRTYRYRVEFVGINKERISDMKRIIRNNLWSRFLLYRSSKTAVLHCSARGKHCTNSSILRNLHSSVIGLVIDYRGNERNGWNVIVNCHINIVLRTGSFGLHISETAAGTRGILLVFADQKTTQEISEERLLEGALPPAHMPFPSNWHTHWVYQEIHWKRSYRWYVQWASSIHSIFSQRMAYVSRKGLEGWKFQ